MDKRNIIWHIHDICIRDGKYQDILYAIDQFKEIISNESLPIKQQLIIITGTIFENKYKIKSEDLTTIQTICEKLNFIKIIIATKTNLDFQILSIFKSNLIDIYNFSENYNEKNTKYNSETQKIIDEIEKEHKNERENESENERENEHSDRDDENEPDNNIYLDNFNNISISFHIPKTKFPTLILPLKYPFEYFSENYDEKNTQVNTQIKKILSCPGSLIQKKGDKLEHGCIKWCIIPNKSKQIFIPFILNNAYLHIYINDDKINYPINCYNNIKYVELTFNKNTEKYNNESETENESESVKVNENKTEPDDYAQYIEERKKQIIYKYGRIDKINYINSTNKSKIKNESESKNLIKMRLNLNLV